MTSWKSRSLIGSVFILLVGTIAAQTQDRDSVVKEELVRRPVNVEEFAARRDDGQGEIYLLGRITDFRGRSINNATVRVFDDDTDAVFSSVTNAFGYYRVAGLTPGHSYTVAVAHRRYLFVTGSVWFLLENKPVAIDFQGQLP